MAKLDRMALIQEKYCSGTKPLAKFLTVYIEECKLRCSSFLLFAHTLIYSLPLLTRFSEHGERFAGQTNCGLPQVNRGST